MSSDRNNPARQTFKEIILEESPNVNAKTVKKILDRIDAVSGKRIKEGFNQRNFGIGVLNALLIAFVVGRYPQHFWLLFLVEINLLMPHRISLSFNAKPLNEILYYLDYCWIMNLLIIIVGVTLSVYAITGWPLSDEFRLTMFATFFGVCCGPLLGAAYALPFVALVFHDITIIIAFFIHSLPPIALYTLRWHASEVRSAWPSVFKLDYLEEVDFHPKDHFFVVPWRDVGTIAGNTVTLYAMWFVPYVSWMLLFGLDLPRKDRPNIVPKYDTVFHSTVRGGLVILIGKVFWNRDKEATKKQMADDHYEARDFMVYIVSHAIAAYSAIYILAYPCYKSRAAHVMLLLLNLIICVRRGASRYTYYVTNMYGKMVRKDYAELLSQSEYEIPVDE
jgi:hypothetical protein